MEKVVDKELYVIYASMYFNYVLPELTNYLDEGIKYNINFFDLEYISKLKIYLYNDIEYYKKIVRVPYQIGTLGGVFSRESVKIFADLDRVDKKRFYAIVLHELTHIIYRNYVQDGDRIVWFDEGLAVYLSKEKDSLMKEDELNKFLTERIINKGIPQISFLHKHGNEYGDFTDTMTNKYNGYDWAYLMIRYLIETMSKEEFNILMRSKKKILSIENNIIEDTYNYFINNTRRKL